MRKTKKLVRRNSYPLDSLFGFSCFRDVIEEFNHSFRDRVWSDWTIDTCVFEVLQPKSTFPKVNVFETDKEYSVEIAIAGFDKEDVSLELKDNCLCIKSDKKEASRDCDDDKKCLMNEVSYKSFRRVVRFPSDIDTEAVDCNYKDGVIKCTIGKKVSEEKNAPIKIDIK